MGKSAIFVSKADPSQRYHNLAVKLPVIDVLNLSAADLSCWTWDKAAGDPYWRLYWNLESGCHLGWGEGRRTELLPEKIVLVAPNLPLLLRHTAGRRVRQLYIHFVVAPPHHDPVRKVWELPAGPARREGLLAMYERITAGGDEAELALAANAWVAEALVAVPREDWRGNHLDERVHLALREIEMRLAEPLSVERLARLAGMSTAAFARLFRRETGKSPHRYVQTRRLDKASRLLKQKQHSIDEVAAESGFCDRYHFSKAFVRAYGVAPAAYRKRSLEATCWQRSS